METDGAGQGDLFGGGGRRIPHAGAYPATPGTGPAGKWCRDCGHRRVTRTPGGARRFQKCALVVETNGAGTDIRAGSPACLRFIEKP